MDIANKDKRFPKNLCVVLALTWSGTYVRIEGLSLLKTVECPFEFVPKTNCCLRQ